MRPGPARRRRRRAARTCSCRSPARSRRRGSWTGGRRPGRRCRRRRRCSRTRRSCRSSRPRSPTRRRRTRPGTSGSGSPRCPPRRPSGSPASRAAVNVGCPSATWSTVSAPPRLMLMTSAPCSRAQSTASRMSPNETKPLSSAILIGISVESGAMPAMPSPLLVSATIVPITWVPWPTWSLTSLVVPDHVARIDDGDVVEVGVGQVDARVDDRDHDRGVAARRRPGLGDADLGEVALLGVARVRRVAVGRPVEERELGVGHHGQHARVGAEGPGDGGRPAGLGRDHESHGRSIGDVESDAGHADRGRGDALPDDDQAALEGRASAARRAVLHGAGRAAGAATPSTSADASSNARRDLVGTGSPFSLWLADGRPSDGSAGWPSDERECSRCGVNARAVVRAGGAARGGVRQAGSSASIR